MAITLSRLFADSEKNYQIRLIAGQKGMHNLVRWVHMVEDSEVPGFLHGNELVFTTGIAQKGTEWIIDFVRSLKRHGAIGLVINLGPYINEVPEYIINYCNEQEFPLFTIPWEMRLIDVTFDFSHRIIANEEHETSVATAFRNLIFSPENREAYVQILERRGFHNKGEYTLMVIEANRDDIIVLGDEWHNIKFGMQRVLKNSDKPICIFVQVNYLVIIAAGMNNTEMKEAAGRLTNEFFTAENDIKVNIGISDTVVGYNEMRSCYHQAITASNTAKLQQKQILNYNETGIYKLIYAVEDAAVLSRYVEDSIGKIIKYDQMHRTDYTNTLKSYLQSNGSILKVSEEMKVHRNTINYKMKFIRETFDLSLDNQCTTELLLAFLIKNIIENHH